MKRVVTLCLVIFGVVPSPAEPFIFNTYLSMAKMTDPNHSFAANIMKIREKTAAINEGIEKTAPAGIFGNFASSVISSTYDTTAGVINSATNAMDVAAKDTMSWLKNISVSYCDKGSDVILNKFQQYALSHSLDNMALPPVETKHSGVQISASGGYFSSFATLHKIKTATLTVHEDRSVSIRIPLSLSTLSAGYTKFTAKWYFMSMSGSMKINVLRNQIDVVLRLRAVNPCALNVDRVEVVAMDGISVEYHSGCKTCGSMISQMSSGLVNFMKNTLVKQVQEGIDNGIRTILKKDSLICAHFVK